MKRNREGGGQWKISLGGQEVHKADELEKRSRWEGEVGRLKPKGVHWNLPR